jgi:hypothetical protein
MFDAAGYAAHLNTISSTVKGNAHHSPIRVKCSTQIRVQLFHRWGGENGCRVGRVATGRYMSLKVRIIIKTLHHLLHWNDPSPAQAPCLRLQGCI